MFKLIIITQIVSIIVSIIAYWLLNRKIDKVLTSITDISIDSALLVKKFFRKRIMVILRYNYGSLLLVKVYNIFIQSNFKIFSKVYLEHDNEEI